MRKGAGVFQALGAAVLFGLSTPLAKHGLAGVPPLAASFLLYLSAGLTLGAAWGLGTLIRPDGRADAPLRRGDLSYLAGAILAGGVVAPALLLYGLSLASGTAASLLLNLELVFTVGIAALLGENVGLRALAGIAAILTGGALLGFDPTRAGAATWLGALAIAGACLAWATDNNVTTRISGKDAVAIAAAKCLGAAPISLGLAFAAELASARADLGALVARMLAAFPAAALVGTFGYGLSLVLFVRALRNLGAARTGSIFATAPFAGAAAAVLLLGEPLTWPVVAACSAMGLGVALVSGDRHEHEHVHDALGHEHGHVTDEHHQHGHEGPEGPEPHAHWHQHEGLLHSHAHVPDLHHRHRHDA